IEEFTRFADRINYANTLTRRRESYHLTRPEGSERGLHDEAGTPNVVDLEARMRAAELPPIDPETRVLIRERMLPEPLAQAVYERGDFDPLWTAGQGMWTGIEPSDTSCLVTFREVLGGATRFEKRYLLSAAGIRAEYRWDPAGFSSAAIFAPEISY